MSSSSMKPRAPPSFVERVHPLSAQQGRWRADRPPPAPQAPPGCHRRDRSGHRHRILCGDDGTALPVVPLTTIHTHPRRSLRLTESPWQRVEKAAVDSKDADNFRMHAGL
jgi:hypothetical protein